MLKSNKATKIFYSSYYSVIDLIELELFALPIIIIIMIITGVLLRMMMMMMMTMSVMRTRS